MTRKTAATAILAAALAAVPLLAQGPGGQGRGRGGRGPGGPGGPGIMGMVQHLDLSDAQRQQLQALGDEERKNGDPGAQVRDAERKLHAAILAETPDLQAIDAARAAVNAAHAAELDHRIEMMEKVAQILTSAQRSQLLKLPPPGPPRG
jgi:Spy/CpxP family protein refolding chaperone